MRFNLWQAVKISMTIVGTTIGAGFASGRELWEFFGSYGEESNSSILLAMTLFFVTTVIILYISWTKKTQNYSEVLECIIGPRLARIFDGLVLLNLLTSTLVMVAGSGATFVQWDGSFFVGVWVMALAVIGVLFFDLKGLMSINTLLIPIMLVVLIFVCLQFISSSSPVLTDTADTGVLQLPAWPSAITYTAFNVISLLAVLSTMGGQIHHPGEIWVGAGVSTLCLALVAGLYNYSLLRLDALISQYDIPLFALIRDYSPVWVGTISLVLWLAIFTTAVSNIYGITFRMSQYVSFPRWGIGVLTLLLLIPLTSLGFGPLVSMLYPVYGVLNLFLLTMLLLYPFSGEGSGIHLGNRIG